MKWIPDWVLKLIGKNVAGKLDLQEDSTMDSKPWYKSRTLWTAVVGGIIGIYNAVSSFHTLPVIPEYVYTVLASFGLWSLRTADKKID